MKRVFLITKGYIPSTAGCNRELALAKGLGEQGVAVKFVCSRPSENFDKFDGAIENVEFVYLWDNSKISNQQINFIRSLCRLFSMIRRGDKILIFWAKLLVLPLSWRGADLYHEMTEHPAVCGKAPRSVIFNRVSKSYMRRLRGLKGLFVITENLKDYFVSHGVRSERISVVNMVVDPSRFENVAQSVASEKYIAYCGAVSVGKDGVDTLIDSFRRVAEKVADVKLYIIGGFISERDRDIIHKCVKDFALQDRIVFTGLVDYSRMPELLKGAEALVLARSDNKQATYGFPTKLGEYLLTGKSVVVTRTGEIDHFLEDMKSAFIVEPNNPDALAEKIIWALENPTLSDEIARRGQRVAMDSFNYKIESKKIFDTIFN
ncbi:MAG: glycosyltransferase family 4 protein [Rikenellaceae bacterium]